MGLTSLQIVFEGSLGEEEEAIVVATKDIFEPGYLSIYNSTDYYDVGGVAYLKEDILSDQTIVGSGNSRK